MANCAVCAAYRIDSRHNVRRTADCKNRLDRGMAAGMGGVQYMEEGCTCTCWGLDVVFDVCDHCPCVVDFKRNDKVFTSQDYWSMQGRFSSIERSLYDYHESHGSYPESLADPTFEFPYGNDSDMLKDLWNKPIQYTVESDGFRLSSFGRDGVPGGIGLDSDWSYDSPDAEPDQSPFRDKPDVRLPLGQFLIDTPATFGILFPGLLFYMMLGHNVRSASEESLKSQRGILVTAIAVTVIGAAICTFLATFHIAASQSSH